MKRHVATFILAALLFTSAPAQERKPKPKLVEPVAVAIVTGGGEDADAREFHRLFRVELNKRRDVAIRHTGADWKLYLNVTAITAKGKIIGYAGAAMVTSKDCELYWLVIKAAPTIEDLVRAAVAALDEGIFHPKKEK